MNKTRQRLHWNASAQAVDAAAEIAAIAAMDATNCASQGAWADFETGAAYQRAATAYETSAQAALRAAKAAKAAAAAVRAYHGHGK